MAPTECRVARLERQWGCRRGTPTVYNVVICNQPLIIRHSTFGTRAFAPAGPTVWNSLPVYRHRPFCETRAVLPWLKNTRLHSHFAVSPVEAFSGVCTTENTNIAKQNYPGLVTFYDTQPGLIDWLIEQGLTSSPTQYRLSGVQCYLAGQWGGLILQCFQAHR